MIKKYGQFINENKQKVNEDFEEFDLPDNTEESQEEDENEESEITNNPYVEESQEEEEEGGYSGAKMMQDLADALDTQIDTDGSINYNGKKINFYSETEMFHIGSQKFETVEDVIKAIDKENGISADDEADEMKNDEIIKQRELEDEDNRVLLSDDESQVEKEFESKSYKNTRKFESFRKK